MEHSMNHGNMYWRFAFMIVLSFIAMYAFMYAMVDIFANVVPNFNQFYMAGLMTAPMIIIEMVIMGMMYPNKRINRLLIIGGIALLALGWISIRQQLAIDDKQFLKSMIPHHGGAILMCNKAKLADPEVKQLCAGIISGQEKEISQMKSILKRLN